MNIKKVKSLFLFALYLVALIGIARFCHQQTQGFRLSKIHANFLEEPSFSQSAQDPERVIPNVTENLDLGPAAGAFASARNQVFSDVRYKPLFAQKFKFLGRGLQSFVFVSEDDQYVLKAFNNRYQRKIAWFSFLTHVPIPMLETWAQKRKNYYQQKLRQTFQSYTLAFDEMREQTGLVFLHLTATKDMPKQLMLVDKLNITHCVNPNQLGFLVQKKATLAFPALKEIVAKGDLQAAEGALSSLVDLFFWKWRHAILDNDPLIRTNYGFINGKAVQIDVGPLSKAPSPPTAAYCEAEIKRITTSLKFWLTENSPELLPYLDRELQQQLSLMP